VTARLSLPQNLFGSLVNHSRDFLDLPALQDDQVGRVVAAAPNSFASACSMVGGGRRSFAEMITHSGSSPAAESLCPKRGNHFVKHALGSRPDGRQHRATHEGFAKMCRFWFRVFCLISTLLIYSESGSGSAASSKSRPGRRLGLCRDKAEARRRNHLSYTMIPPATGCSPLCYCETPKRIGLTMVSILAAISSAGTRFGY
jgi:hypothetical protein